MAHPQEKRDLVRRKYVFENQSLELAAIFSGVPLATARTWKKSAKEQGDDWDKARSVHLFAGGGVESLGQLILSAFLMRYQSTFEHLDNDEKVNSLDKVRALASLADSYAKMVNTHKKVMPETQAAAVALQVVEELLNHISETYPDKLQDFALILQTFETVIERKFGG